MEDKSGLILVTGATGYVGGRLLRALESQKRQLCCLARRPEALKARVGASTRVIGGDVLDARSLGPALKGVHTAYYLVHSMSGATGFEANDRKAAQNFAAAARSAGIQRIIYLGGLGQDDEVLSPHLRSRQEVGRILRESGCQVIEFRASIVIGSGSLSFEMIRSLVEHLPVMVTPRWVSVAAQPIAIGDLLDYLIAALDIEAKGNRTYEIGGTDVVSYRDLMGEYARQRGLRRLMIAVPVLTPRLSSLWLGLVTPLYARVGRILIDSIRHPTLVRDASASIDFPIRPRGIHEAIATALRDEDQEFAETRWSDALSTSAQTQKWGGLHFGNRLVDSRTATVNLAPDEAFKPIERIGGTTGWYAWGLLWQTRGILDLVVGGVGMRRGRKDSQHLKAGDVVDCWRVAAIEPNRRLLLQAEMRLPGRAWLEFEVASDGQTSTIRQTAIFDPIGVPGLVYWYALIPVHQLVFGGMLRGIVRRGQLKVAPPGASGSS